MAPTGTSIIATMKPALRRCSQLLPATKRAIPGRALRAGADAADPIPADYLLHALAATMPRRRRLVEEAPSHRPAMQHFCRCAGQDSFYTMASGGLG